MTETIIVHLEVILVKEFVSAGRTVALHRAEVLTPARASCILFQSLLLGASAMRGGRRSGLYMRSRP